ncbi:MAG: YicC family protein [Proteobacteria bacterium]|nr:YicC family protein [Pseudomonadota bacterium]MBI3495790.1 YicC family protein [Pseudomonadota bacterium]
MTGFARAEGTAADLTWVWELKSVNGRTLDVRCRLPPGLDRLEPVVRAGIGKPLKRGNVSVNLAIQRASGQAPLAINRAALDRVLALQSELSGLVDSAPPRLEALLAVPGVVERGSGDGLADPGLDRELVEGFSRALAQLVGARLEEGARLVVVLNGQLAEIERLMTAAGALVQQKPEAMRERLASQLAQLLEAKPPVSEERLAQELALLAVKGDVREELDRLGSHLAQARELLAAGGAVGRRLDFLCQEFNREANTLCSKSTEVGLTRLGLDLKTVIDQLREQVQNLE